MNYAQIVKGYADEMTVDGAEYETFVIQSTLHLQTGDKVWVQIWGTSQGAYVEGLQYTDFTGWLLDEDISQSLKYV